MEIEEQARQLADAVNITLDSTINQKRRMEAYQICETFKEKSPHCVACGMYLSDAKNSPVIRHFGLQLLEHFVRFKWNDASQNEKVQFKEITLQLITKGAGHILETANYIKEGQVKILVEMVKREWPQHWPSLLSELDQMSQIGDSQTELVLLFLLRLVEDVVSFRNLQQRRRRDLWQALTSNMADIFSFLFVLLQKYCEKYEALMVSQPQSTEAMSACKVTQTVLLTLCGFVEWVGSEHLFMRDNALIVVLYGLLRKDDLKMLAAECLQLIVNRKGKIEERKPLMVLLCESAMVELFNAANKACNAGIDEMNHLFIKKLCQVITGLGTQICAVWASEGEKFERPPSLASFLKTLFAFTQHASIQVCHLTLASWTAFLRHEYMSCDPAVKEIIPSLSQTFTTTIQKIGFPSQSDSPACAYSRLEFDSDDEFFQFFANHRHHQLEIMRLATAICPETTFSIASHWLQEMLSAPLQKEGDKELCTPHSPSYIKWDALTGYLDSVMTTLIRRDELPVQPAIELLQATLNSKIQDPMILSCQLTCISVLFPVLHHAKQYVEGVLAKLFIAAVYSLPGLTKKTRTRSVQNVRRHACSALVKMCRDHQDLMLPHFEKIYSQVQTLSSDPDQLTQLERVTLNEAVILLNNGLHNFERQSALIAEIMQPITKVWQSQTISEMVQSPDMFIHHIGLAQPSSVQPSQEDTHNRNRAQVFNCLSTSLAVIKRSCWPSDPEVAEAGGFVSGHLPNGTCIYKNPCTPHIVPLLPNLFTLARTLNGIWAPEIRAKVCPEYTKSYDMTDNERNTILGVYVNSLDIHDMPSNKPVMEKVQTFLNVIYENICHLFADSFQRLGYEFYATEGLSDQLLGSIFANLHHLPDYRIRHIIRVVAKSLVQFCPSQCWQSVLVPAMSGLNAHMVNRLKHQWAAVIQKRQSSSKGDEREEELEAQEVLEEHLTRAVTREHMELIGLLCWKKTHASAGSGGVATAIEGGGGGGGGEGGEDDMEMDGMDQAEGDPGAVQTPNKPDMDNISDMGKVMLQHERLCESLVMCVYSAMSWPDTGVCIKACRLSWLVLQQLALRPLLPEAAAFLYTSILQGLQVHGEHDTCLAELVLRALQHYELLREKYPVLTEMMKNLPECSEQAMQQFHQRVLGNKAMSEKKKKDAFKKLLVGVIGQHVSQKFKRNEVIKDLPAIYKPRRYKPSPIDEEGEDAGLVMLFRHSDDL
ncbi:exportin-5-like [Diadema antillarum]|uniref:exportin-5-like n=1 Tax=Diadema antillarum TaxID=105358 RepID=UPI003A8AC948